MNKYNLNIVELDGEKTLEDSDYTYHSSETAFHKLLVDTIVKLQSLPDFNEIKFKRNKDDIEIFGLDESPTQDIDIDIILADNNEVLDFYHVPNNVLGVCCTSAGVFEEEDMDCVAAKQRVIIIVDEEAIKKRFSEERNQELDPSSDRNDGEYLFSELATVAHELAHAVEFIECSHGLSPQDAESMFEDGEQYLSLNDLGAGRGVYIGSEVTDYETLHQVMEERVESKGRDWLSQIELDSTLFEDALTEYAPKPASNSPTFIP